MILKPQTPNMLASIGANEIPIPIIAPVATSIKPEIHCVVQIIPILKKPIEIALAESVI